ncbi:geminivirus Rep catalytic domain protein [Candidatus Phytoplasma oryzae]|uniref:Geminivirus Rep catalytic domain protein n=2 Tax=Candidatus Phytoplasma oryzae TaxID=203274 RepID=A0A139JQ57_9MOLU|nr:geminivirus Rep catalytic domain protein [Candidatus Phytoplasma oryzae]
MKTNLFSLVILPRKEKKSNYSLVVVQRKQKINTENEKEFFVQGKNIGFTYDYCPLKHFEIVSQIKDKIALYAKQIKKLIVIKSILFSNETHQDGSLHSHGFLQLNRKLRIRKGRAFFRLQDNHNHFYNPSLTTTFPDTTDNWYNYILKKDDIYSEGKYCPVYSRKKTLNQLNLEEKEKENLIYQKNLEIRKAIENKLITLPKAHQLLNEFAENTSYKWCIKHHHELDYMKYKNMKLFIEINRRKPYPLDSFMIEHPEVHRLIESIKNNLDILKEPSNGRHQLKAIVVQGSRGIGKTELIEAIANHFEIDFNRHHRYFNFDSDNHKEGVLMNLIDDVGIPHILKEKLFKEILGCQVNYWTREPYGRKRQILTLAFNVLLVNKDESVEDWCKNNKERKGNLYKYALDSCVFINFDKYKFDQERPLFYSEAEKALRKKFNGNASVEMAKLMFDEKKFVIFKKN